MPLFKRWEDKGIYWGIWKVTESPEELWARLTDDRCQYVNELEHLKSPSRKLEYLAVRVLLKELGGKEYSIGHLPSGKPYLTDRVGSLTISHTHGYVAVGIHPLKNIPLGIDIEYFSERVRKVTSRFIRTDELPDFGHLSLQEQLYQLLLHWSGKETLYKILDTVQVDFREHLRILPFSRQEEGIFFAREYRTDSQEEYRVAYMCHPDFVCTWYGG